MKRLFQKERSTGGEAAVQLRTGGQSAFGGLDGYVPLRMSSSALPVQTSVP